MIEADVDIGFALIDEAKEYRAAGQSQFSVGAINEALRVLADIEDRLHRLGNDESCPFLPLVKELRNEIEIIRKEISPRDI